MDKNIYSQKPLRRAIYEELKEEILKGELSPGTRLMEVMLSKEKGASRTPVRDAIKLLAHDGLVDIRPNRGAYVKDVSLGELIDVLEVREEIDGMAAYYAAARADEAVLRDLQYAKDQYKKALELGEIGKTVFWDAEFNKIVIMGTGNKTLMELMEKLDEKVLRFRYVYYEKFENHENIVEEHTMLFEAISKKDSTRAGDIARRHTRLLREKIATGFSE